MFGIGGWELLVIGVVALVVLGPKGLPAAARAIGRVVSELRRATTDLRQSIELDPDLRDIPRALDEINRPLMAPSYSRPKPMTPKDGPPDDLPPPPQPRGRRDVEEGVPAEASSADAAPSPQPKPEPQAEPAASAQEPSPRDGASSRGGDS